jgi:hypothetical protein
MEMYREKSHSISFCIFSCPNVQLSRFKVEGGYYGGPW